MSIELKQAAQQAIEAIQDLRGYRPDIDKAIEALRAAIQQADAKTDEPVAYVCPTSHHTHDGSMEDGPDYLEWADEASDYEKRVGTPLYTHPAPGVPDGWRRVFESARNRLQDDEPSAFDNSGYRSYASNVLDGVEDELEAIDTTMLTAAQAQKGQQ